MFHIPIFLPLEKLEDTNYHFLGLKDSGVLKFLPSIRPTYHISKLSLSFFPFHFLLEWKLEAGGWSITSIPPICHISKLEPKSEAKVHFHPLTTAPLLPNYQSSKEVQQKRIIKVAKKYSSKVLQQKSSKEVQQKSSKVV